MVSIEIPLPDDWHVHLRDDDMLAAVVSYSAVRYRYAMVMPNLRPPVVSLAQAEAYQKRILAQVPHDITTFRPLQTFFLSDQLDLGELRAGAASGLIKAVKFYPAGATTNSDQAKGALADFDDVYDVLAELGLRLLVHAESTRPDIDVFDREAQFIEDELSPLCSRRPELLVTLEHVSTAAGVQFVESNSQVAASVTPHHLARDRGDLLADGMKPDLYCKPIINSPADREALITAVTAKQDSFVLGTDSAPHPTAAKYGPTAAAGVFNAPYGLEAVAEVFHQAGALARLEAFVSSNGCSIYGVDRPSQRLRLTRSDEPRQDVQTELVTGRGEQVVFFGVDEATHWQIERVLE